MMIRSPHEGQVYAPSSLVRVRRRLRFFRFATIKPLQSRHRKEDDRNRNQRHESPRINSAQVLSGFAAIRPIGANSCSTFSALLFAIFAAFALFANHRPADQGTTGSVVSASMARRRLYLASLSDWLIEPTLIWSADQPTARSASQLSSVSPLRALMVTLHPASRASLSASAASVSVPIWFTLSSKAFAD